DVTATAATAHPVHNESNDNNKKPVINFTSNVHRLVSDSNSNITQISSQTLTFSKLIRTYRDLAKARLAALVILTTMCGYAMAPMATDLTCLFATTAGTGLCIASANTFNQLMESSYDAQMSRTRNRVLVRKVISPLHATSFGTITGITGVGILSTMVNPLTAILGLSNILLYTCIYTPMKRVSIVNTWVGSVVGAIPPMMGWAACTNSLDLGAWILGSILYAWQFPHFNALAWNMRNDYAKAGYRMMVVKNPSLNSRVSLRYSLLLFPLSYIIPYIGMTSWWFALDSTIINSGLLWGAFRFWRNSNDKTARDLFFGSLVHLPVILALMMAHKKNWRTMDDQNDDLEINSLEIDSEI
ncbi:16678_t:CDS:1, partial [Funneliformis mosseae]